jgi:hypothetical protein
MSASVLRYRKLVTTDLANQAVNLAESGTMGHRVQIPMSVDDLNAFFVWDRPAGSQRAVGHFVATSSTGVKFDNIMVNSLSKVYTDVDGITNGLNFSSAILDANTDSRLRLNGNVSANDIVMSYLLFKCYGSSAAPTMSVVYNLEDAQQMLSSGTLTMAIHNSLSTEEALSTSASADKGAVDAMFRDLLAADPMRFFDATGKQIAGLFETNTDADSTGSWGFVQNDKIEMRVQFNFTNSVTRRGVQDPSMGGGDEVDNVIIAAGSKFTIRLQIVATDTPSGAAEKAGAQANAIADALAAQVASTKKAADNAAAAQRAATETVNAAANQTASANARYQKAVADNVAQATAVSNAMAASRAAQAALDQAIVSGKTQSEIQNQRAAAVAAEAAAQNAKAIADAGAADLQNARNAQDAAAASLAAAQTAAAAAAANVAKANAAAAAAAVAASTDAAAKAAASKAAADAASDPLTKQLTDAEKKILDPQTVITLQAQMNAKVSARVVAKTAADNQQAAAELATQKSTAAAKALSDAIALGQTLSTIQILRAAAVSAAAEMNSANVLASSATQTFIDAARAELAAQQLAAKASSDACVLRLSMANAEVNATERKRASADAANTAAQLANTTAQTAATNAQAALDAAIASGAVLIEVQVKRAAALDTRTAAAAAKAAADAAAAALADAVAKKAEAVTAAATADQARIADSTASSAQATLINDALVESTRYQNSKVYLANANARAQEFNRAQMSMNDAKQKLDAAKAAYVIAKDALDTAVTAGKTVPEVVALRTVAQAAADRQAQAQSIYNTSVTEFDVAEDKLQKGLVLDASGNPTVDGSGNLVLNTNNIWDASANALLIQAATDNLTSITNAQANTLVLAYIAATAAAATASNAANDAKNKALLARQALQNGITGGLTLPQITALSAASVAAASEEAKAVAAANAANTAALNALGRVFTPGPTYADAIAILNAMRILQDQANNQARTNAAVLALNAAYAKDTDAQKALVVAEYAQYVAESALNDAVVGGKTQAEITTLRSTAQAAAQLTASAQQTADFTAAALEQQLAWAAANKTIDNAGAEVTEAYTTDASGLVIYTESIVAATAAAKAAICNSLVRQYMDLLAKAKAARTATYNQQSILDTATAALNTAITQGRDLSTLQQLQANVQAATNTLAALKAAENLANAAAASSLASLLVKDPSGNFINADAKDVLDAAAVAQERAIDRATANTQVNAYVAAFSAYQQALTVFQTAQSASLIAAKNLDTAITAGGDVASIQALRTILEQARATESVALAARDRANDAQNALRIAIETGTRDASGNMLASAEIAKDLLEEAQLAQQAAIAGAESNARARAFYKAVDAQAAANVDLVNKQAAYDTAATLLDQAITGGATIAEIQALRASAQAAGNALSAAQATATAAANAVTIAREGVNQDANAIAILNSLQLYQANKAALAKANSLMAAWNAAKAVEAGAQNDYNLALEAQRIAAAALDAAIAGGAGITEIQALRDVSVAAGTAASNALVTLNLKKAATLQARQDAGADPLATVITDAAAQFDKLAVASAAVNSAILALETAQAVSTAATAKYNADNALSTAANQALNLAIVPYSPTQVVDASGNVVSSPFGGKTEQEIVELRAAATAAAATAAASKLAADAAVADSLVKTQAVTAAELALAAIPFPQLESTLSYNMTAVSMNELKVATSDASGNAGNFIYIDSVVLQRANTGVSFVINGNTITYPPVDLSGVEILGLGVTAPTPTRILDYKIVPSRPGGLYVSAVELKVNNPVSVGNGIFYLVGGEVLLNDFLM